VKIRYALLLALLLAGTGCATVKPYERESLARSDMQLDRDADLASGSDHATAYREGTGGAIGASGGGCGCN
jgi:hypothetical protein